MGSSGSSLHLNLHPRQQWGLWSSKGGWAEGPTSKPSHALAGDLRKSDPRRREKGRSYTAHLLFFFFSGNDFIAIELICHVVYPYEV